MNETICVLDVKIDNCSAKQAMKASVEYMSTAATNVVELVTIETLMSAKDKPDLRKGGDSGSGGNHRYQAYSRDESAGVS